MVRLHPPARVLRARGLQLEQGGPWAWTKWAGASGQAALAAPCASTEDATGSDSSSTAEAPAQRGCTGSPPACPPAAWGQQASLLGHRPYHACRTSTWTVPAKPLPLRSALRALYRRVHPDLFHDSATAKAENERSLKLLHEYLALARGGDGRSPAARLPYRFVFYMREAPSAITTADSRTLAGPTRKALAEAARPSDPAVMVSFANKLMPPAKQVALLERLAVVVDAVARSARVRLGGCHIVIGDRLGLDRLGHLCVAADEDDAAWRAFLTGVDLGFVAQQRKTVQAIRTLESKVAKAVGLAQVYTQYGNLAEPSYRTFLERYRQGQPREPDFKLDSNVPGVVQHEDAGLAELTERVRNRLRLRSLTRDGRVAPGHYRRACGLMLEQAAALGALLEGATVRVAFANRLAPDGSAIEIAWNCEL
eukprot:XP_001695952.1 predicted protein [Chlamydomonas reinhardtii]